MNDTQLEVRHCAKFAEIDLYEDGCQLEGGTDSFHAVHIAADCTERLVDKLMAYVGVDDRDAVEIDACEEWGRIDIARTETDGGDEPTAAEIEEWKRGEMRLWYVIYSFRAEWVTREIVRLGSV